MGGIVGYIGNNNACPILIEGLKKLEYRGYDSAGVALLNEGRIEIIKTVGRPDQLELMINERSGRNKGCIGIGHTRGATHGRPSEVNSHPHGACSNDFVVVHNGIIENYQKLREWLTVEGHFFSSETDSEVLPHLIEHYYNGELIEAVRRSISKVQGSYAIAVISNREPDKIICVKKHSPLVIGPGEECQFIASDIPAVLGHTRNVFIMEDEEIGLVEQDRVSIYNGTGKAVNKKIFRVEWDQEAVEMDGFDHFMLKEIFEQPWAIKETLKDRLDLDNYRVKLEELSAVKEELKGLKKINIAACGTAYHAGLIGKNIIEKLARIPVEVELASEYRYNEPIIDPDSTLVMIISQSGETADSMAALRLSKNLGAKVLAVTNVVGSSAAREADLVIHTQAGPEIAVASTKAYITQLTAMYLVALYIAQLKETVPASQIKEIIDGLRCIPNQMQTVLEQAGTVKKLAEKISSSHDLFFIGRGLDYAVALEGSLKLKEISYIHAEAYAAGELKHGTMALVTEETPIVALLTQEHIYEKTISNIKEVKARDAFVTVLAVEGDEEAQKEADEVIYIPQNLDLLMPLLAVVPLQLLAYYTALLRGCNVDKPRNLSKSVTVE